MAIIASGRIAFYERDGKLQLYVEYVEAIGEGALFLRFEGLKERLAAEGLFDEERKRILGVGRSHPEIQRDQIKAGACLEGFKDHIIGSESSAVNTEMAKIGNSQSTEELTHHTYVAEEIQSTDTG